MLTTILNLHDPHVGAKVHDASNWVVYVNTVKMAALPSSSSKSLSTGAYD